MNRSKWLEFIKPARQHLIYGVFAIVLAVLIYNGLFILLPLLAFFYFRFVRWYWVFFLLFAASFMWLHVHSTQPSLPDPVDYPATFIANIKRTSRQNDDRQTAIIEMDGHRVFMTFRDSYPRLVPGQTIRVYGRLTVPTPPTVPYRFNFHDFLRHQHIHLTIHASDLTIVDTNFSPWRIQHDLADSIRNTFPPPTSTYLQSFFLGLRDDMDEETMNVYSDIGIVHIFAISGVHVTLLAGILSHALKRIGLIDVFVDVILIIFCITFIFITGGSISIVRASSMSIIAIINRRLKFDLSSFDVFSIVFIVSFLVNPLLVYQRGFQFSFWIAFALICSRPTLRGLTPIKARMAIVFLARIASIPISVSSGYEINLTSYISNLVLASLLMQIIVPVLLITMLLPVISPFTNFLLSSFEHLNQLLHPVLSINVIFGSVPLIVVILLMGLLLINVWYYEKYRKLWIRILLIMAYVVVLESNRLWQPYTTITFLDVGQGDATIIRSPYHSCTVVIDTGGDVSRVRSNHPSIFTNTLEPYLLGSGIRTVDYLILTHEHYDHIAEAIPLMNRLDVRNIILSEAEADQQLQAIIDEAKLLGIRVHIARPSDSFTCGNQRYTFIHDRVNHLDVNEDSLVMAVSADGFNVLLTGDIGHPREAAILRNNPFQQVDVYQVAHHGSRHSNSHEFMSALNIRYAVVQVGRRNFYGHPSQELFDVTGDLNIPLLSNAIHGTVQFRLRNGEYTIHIWPWEE